MVAGLFLFFSGHSIFICSSWMEPPRLLSTFDYIELNNVPLLAVVGTGCGVDTSSRLHNFIFLSTKAIISFAFFLLFACAIRYMTAFTDSDEEEPRDTEQGQEEQPTNKLCVLLERIDRLHQGTELDKRESLDVLLEHRDEVSCLTVILVIMK